MKIKILDQKFDLDFGNPGIIESEAVGRCCVAKSSIWIKKQLADDISGSTLVHEIIHAVADMQGITITEQDVCCLERGIYSFMVNNPDIVTKIVNKQPLID